MGVEVKIASEKDSDIRIELHSSAVAKEQRSKTQEVLRPTLHFEVLTSAEITPEIIDETANLYRLIFNNVWGDYLVCIDCDLKLADGMRVSPQKFFAGKMIDGKPYDGKSPVSLEAMDAVPDKELPCCSGCEKPMERFHDPAKTREVIGEKLRNDGYLSLARDAKGEIIGHTFANGGRLEDVIQREWGHFYNFIAKPESGIKRNPYRLIHLLNQGLPGTNLTADTPALIWNDLVLVTDPRFRGMGLSFDLTKNLFEKLRQEKPGQLAFGETEPYTPVHSFFTACDVTDIDTKEFFGEKEIGLKWEIDEVYRRTQLGAKTFYSLRKKF